MRHLLITFLFLVCIGCQNQQHQRAVQTLDSLRVVTHAYNQLLMSTPVDSLQFYQSKLNALTLSIKTNLDSAQQQQIFSMTPEYFQLNAQYTFLMQSEKALQEIAAQDIQRLSMLAEQMKTGSSVSAEGHPLDDEGIEALIVAEKIHTDSLVNACQQMYQNATRALEKARIISPLFDEKVMSPINQQ